MSDPEGSELEGRELGPDLGKEAVEREKECVYICSTYSTATVLDLTSANRDCRSRSFTAWLG